MIERVVPEGVARAETFDDVLPRLPDPRELALLRGRPEAAVRRFAAARSCAHHCLDQLSEPYGPLLRTVEGGPAWPSGVVGSITHCAGYRGAVAARTEVWAALGVDAEQALPLPPGVLDLVATGPERRGVAELSGVHPGVPWDRLLFSAKESVYKAWHPATGRWIGTRAIEVAFTADGLFTASVRPERTQPPPARRRPHVARATTASGGVPPPARGAYPYTGRWYAGDGLLLTAVAVPGAGTRSPGPPRPAVRLSV
ncbi:4'-phosphopantetheinyl transferase family protein [Streptomyces sp. VB1]|uniref:4'-phosphopantetheinyl transferase family protein n=1 Tax=Streptomyces sp. VB1 TaxID=2986803 RepID=UPI002242908A|nr:4'-phosphopantetheinyl transferase superfamily protein [Streptomyces sp. VB1]UZI27622.1 4'-phosphopantetheinyl transferase superfamily protein [Streptomyces sp. VB1]